MKGLPEAQNIVLGAGFLYFAEEDANGNTSRHERYMGDTPGFELAVSSQNLEVFSSDDPIAEKIRDITTQVNRSATITARNVSGANLALFLIGDVDSVSQGASSVTDESITGVKLEHWIQLGLTASDPIGARNVSNVVVTDSAGTTTYVEGTDYEVDLDEGALFIKKGGSITDGQDILVDYDKAAVSYERIITSATTGAKKGRLRYRAANTEGENRSLVIPRAVVRPDGTISWKSRDTVQQITYAVGFERKGDLAQAYINGVPV